MNSFYNNTGIPNNYIPYPNYSTPIPQPNYNQPTYRPVGLSGRMINSPEDIRPNEIPMNGSASFFPMADLSCVIAKAWNADGNIITAKYVLEDQSTAIPMPDSNKELEKLINDKFEKLEKLITQRHGNYQKPKKEDVNE